MCDYARMCMCVLCFDKDRQSKNCWCYLTAMSLRSSNVLNQLTRAFLFVGRDIKFILQLCKEVLLLRCLVEKNEKTEGN